MSISPKSISAQLFRMMIYQRALHPELFHLQGRRTESHEKFEAECWVIPAGHVVRFQANGTTLTETVIEKGDHLPEMGLVNAIPCLGEKDYEMEGDDLRVGYVTTIQTETLTDNLYMATYREMRDFITETQALACQWSDADGVPCLSLLDTQKYRKEYHFQAYHLLGVSGTVLRTQSIFEVR
jgi:hypothetical protein